MKLTNILVPTDFSKFSDKAIETALFFAKMYGAKIILLHSILLFHEEGDDGLQLNEYLKYVKDKEAATRDRMQPHLDNASNQGIVIEAKILRGFSAADTILEFLSENPCDLVVMGTHGRTGFKKWIYGSVAEKVVRLSPTPVLSMHYSEAAFQLRRILVPVDFSEYSQKSIAYAQKMAKDFESELVYLHAIYNEFHPSYFAMGAESLLAIDPELKERSLERLKNFANHDPDATYLVVEGSAYHAVVEYADENNVDLIVMATRGLTGLDHYLVGSTTERVVQLAKTPVLTIERERS